MTRNDEGSNREVDKRKRADGGRVKGSWSSLRLKRRDIGTGYQKSIVMRMRNRMGERMMMEEADGKLNDGRQ